MERKGNVFGGINSNNDIKRAVRGGGTALFVSKKL
jgi:hypothetical protein